MVEPETCGAGGRSGWNVQSRPVPRAGAQKTTLTTLTGTETTASTLAELDGWHRLCAYRDRPVRLNGRFYSLGSIATATGLTCNQVERTVGWALVEGQKPAAQLKLVAADPGLLAELWAGYC